MAIQLPLLFSSGGTGNYVPPTPQTIELSEESPRILKRFGPSNLIVDQVPDFINKDHEAFRRFVEAYYEWLEQYQNAFGIIDAFTELTDIDRTIGLFLNDFRAMYLTDFPYQLALDSSGNIVSEANFLKNIRSFYGSKGTEKGYRFLFRVLYNTTMEMKYPSKDIIKCSDGEWIEKVSLKTTNNGGTANFQMVGRQVYQIDDVSETVLCYATVEDVVQYDVKHLSVNEVFIKNISGVFQPNTRILVETSSGILTETTYPVISDVRIVSSGTGYSTNDPVGITGNNTSSGSMSVGNVDSKGRIGSIAIRDSGLDHVSPALNVISNTGDGTARLEAIVGAVTYYPGYYGKNRSKLSSTGRIYDGDYYQYHSYVLRTEISLSRYRELYKKLIHPAGFKMFGDILVKRNIVDSLPFHSEMQRYEIPFIGHYTPYRMGTTADLYSVYPYGFNPRGDTYSNTQNYGGTAGKLFLAPVGAGFTFNSSQTWLTVGGSGACGNGITANVFEFNILNSGGTFAVMLLKKVDFNTASGTSVTGSPFLEGATLRMYTASAGYTATAVWVRFGTGIVPEVGGFTHDTQGRPLGSSLGVEGYIEAKGLSYSYWKIHHHPNTRSIKGLTGVMNGVCGPGASFGAVALNPFFKMPIGYHFHSSAIGTPYEGTTGTNNEYGLIEGTNLASPNY